MIERKCGECSLCCKLLPVREFKKPANKPCVFQRAGKGCTIHNGKTYPRSCALWSCAWLVDAKAADLDRPDRSRYVVDPLADYVEVDRNDGSPLQRVSVVQVWCDPKNRNAHRDPALRAYLAERAERLRQAAVIRYSATDAIVLVPPAMSSTGDWYEHTRSQSSGEHTTADIVEWHRAQRRDD
jgi:hypothetical protein